MRVWREQVIGRPNKEIFTEAEYEARIPYLKRAFVLGFILLLTDW